MGHGVTRDRIIRLQVAPSGATVWLVKRCLLCAAPLLGAPPGLLFHHGVEDREQFPHTGDEGHFFDLACRTEARIGVFCTNPRNGALMQILE